MGLPVVKLPIRLPVVGLKFNPYHAPAGTPEGGQFTSANGMASPGAAVQMRKGPETKPGTRSIVEIAQMFEKGGPVEWDITKAKTDEERRQIEANIERAIQTAERELRYQASLPADFKNWYSNDVREAFEITQKHIPSLAEPNKRAIFSVIAGIMANGTNPTENWNIAAKAMEWYEVHGTIPGKNPYTNGLWSYRPQMESGLNALDRMIKNSNEASAIQWLTSEHSDWQRQLARQWYMGRQPEGTFVGSQKKAVGLTILGPKVGAFIGNMNGLHDVTIDKWATRTFNRYFKNTTEITVDRGVSRRTVRDKPSDKERTMAQRIFTEAGRRTGLLPEQAQAGLWFFEQQMYRHLGGTAVPESFSGGARKFDSWKKSKRKPGKSSALFYTKEVTDPEVPPWPTDEELKAYKWIADVMRQQVGLDNEDDAEEQDDSEEKSLKYSPDQPRDDHGRWEDEGGGGGKAPAIASIEVHSMKLPVVSIKEWDESKHPRVPAGSGDPSGQFTSGGEGGSEGGASSTSKPVASGLSQQRAGDEEFVRIESALAKKMGMEFIGSKDGQNQFKITDREAFNKAVEEYNTRPDAWGGKVLNTDIAREISPDYLADRTLSAAVHEPASAFIKELYAQKLAEKLPDGTAPTVLFTAGGTGAGKSTGLELPGMVNSVNQSHIIYDTNMNTYRSAESKVQQALDAGHNVTVMAVYRDPVDAMRGAMGRAKNQEAKFGTGRTVPIVEHAKTHAGYIPVIQKLDDKFGGTGRFSVVGVDNSLGLGKAAIVPFKSFKSPPSASSLEPKLHEVVDEAYRTGQISERIYRGFKAPTGVASGGGKASRVAGGNATVRTVVPDVRGGVRAGAQQARAGGGSRDLPVVKLRGWR